jgi:hypothetical protein
MSEKTAKAQRKRSLSGQKKKWFRTMTKMPTTSLMAQALTRTVAEHKADVQHKNDLTKVWEDCVEDEH